MKVLFLTHSLSRKAGGLFFSVRSLAKQLLNAGVDSCAIAPHDEMTDLDVGQWAPVPVASYPVLGPKSLGFSTKIAGLIGWPDIQHIHGIWMYHSHVNRSAAREKSVPYVISPRGMLDEWAISNSRAKKKLAGWLYENRHLAGASCIHALCEAEAESIRRFGLKNPICVIPNGVDVPATLHLTNPYVIESPSDLPLKPKTLLFLGRIHPKKGLTELLTAFGMLDPTTRAGWKLVIAGWDQGHQATLHDVVRRLRIDHLVEFVGPQFGLEKDTLFRQCDAFVLPSHSEGLPVSVLEAWSYAKPTLITTSCNLPEGKENQATVECHPEVFSIRGGLQELFGMSAERRRMMGLRAFRLVNSRFSWPVVGFQMRQVYEWLLGQRDAPKTVRFCDSASVSGRYRRAG